MNHNQLNTRKCLEQFENQKRHNTKETHGLANLSHLFITHNIYTSRMKIKTLQSVSPEIGIARGKSGLTIGTVPVSESNAPNAKKQS